MFTTLEFKNFRGFADLNLAGLKPVNLVVGRNNAGKTSFLEGIALLADPRSVETLPTLLRPFWQGSRGTTLRWLLRDQSTEEQTELSGVYSNAKLHVQCRRPAKRESRRLLEMQQRGIDLIQKGAIEVQFAKDHQKLKCQAVSVQHHSLESLVKVYANAVKRKNGEERIEQLLREVDPRIQKVRLYPADNRLEILVDIGLPEALPVSEVGQGIYRLITIFSELIGEKPNVCIIDEIENGIHHSMLEQVWSGLAAAATDLNVQVFATTHSQECIEAAHAAFSHRETYDLSIIQLFRVEDGVQGRVLDQKHIEAAMAGEIDLR